MNFGDGQLHAFDQFLHESEGFFDPVEVPPATDVLKTQRRFVGLARTQVAE